MAVATARKSTTRKSVDVAFTVTEAQLQEIVAKAVAEALSAKTPAKAPAKAKTPVARKPRPKATHGKGVTSTMVNEYRTMWKLRVSLRKELGLRKGDLTAFEADAACEEPRMQKVVARMDTLKALGVNPFLVKW